MKNQIIDYSLTNELKQLIIDNPKLPLVFLCGDEVNDGDYRYVTATNVTASIGEILNGPFDELQEIYTDREEFADYLYEYYSYMFDGNEAEYDDYIQKKLNKYEPYWIEAIIVYVD